jgi:hypothetical protein
MSSDLLTELAEYGEFHRTHQEPIDSNEVVAAPIHDRPVRGTGVRSGLATAVGMFALVLVVGLIGALVSLRAGQAPFGPSDAGPSTDEPSVGSGSGTDLGRSGLGTDGPYFVLDDPDWAVFEAWEYPAEDETYSSYDNGDLHVAIKTGLPEMLEESRSEPDKILTLNSTEVFENSFGGEDPDTGEWVVVLSYSWLTSDDVLVDVRFRNMDREQALELSTRIRPIDADRWQQLVATTPPTTIPDSDLQARTGRFGSGGEEGFGEWIRLDLPDAPEVILELAQSIVLPPDASFKRLIDNLPDEPTEMTEEGVKSMLEFEAGCLWTGYWIDSTESGASDAQAEAQAVLDEIPSWPALNATDGGGVIDAWTRNAEFAAEGDVQGVLDNLYTNNCTDVVPGE